MRIDIAIKRNDRRPSILGDLYEPDGTPALLTGATVKFLGKQRGAAKTIGGNATIVTATAELSRVRYDWQTTDTDTAGDFDCEWEVTDGAGKKETYPQSGYLLLRVLTDLG